MIVLLLFVEWKKEEAKREEEVEAFRVGGKGEGRGGRREGEGKEKDKAEDGVDRWW